MPDQPLAVPSARSSPWERLDELERATRDVSPNYSEHQGLDRLKYPTTAAVTTAWTYLELGRDFEAAGDEGAAARAYWAALGVAGRAFGSRPAREQVRHDAYAALAAIAERRRQTRWAALLRLITNLADTYLHSAQAADDASSFRSEISRMVGADEAARAAARSAAIAQAFAGINAGIHAIEASATNDQGLKQQSQAEAQALGQEIAATDAAKDQATSALGKGAAGLRSHAKNDVSSVEGGRTFAGEEVAAFLLNAADPEPYLHWLRSFAKDKPALDEAVHAFAAGDNADDKAKRQRILQIALAMRELELEAVRCERLGQACDQPPAPPSAPPPPSPPNAPPSPSPPPPPTTPGQWQDPWKS